MKKVSIIGFGRFGKTLFRLIRADYEIVLFDINKSAFNGLSKQDRSLTTNSLLKVFASDAVFYCVPINKFESIINSHKKHFRPGNLLVDVLSVKVHPKNVFQKVLAGLETQALLIHPMFGPDSSKEGFNGLPLVMDKFKTDARNCEFWKKYFSKKGLRVVELAAEEHDKLSAKSQALAHFIGRGLSDINYQKTRIDTKGAQLLSTLMDLTTHDSKELFPDLQKYNPYTKRVRVNFVKSLMAVNELLK